MLIWQVHHGSTHHLLDGFVVFTCTERRQHCTGTILEAGSLLPAQSNELKIHFFAKSWYPILPLNVLSETKTYILFGWPTFWGQQSLYVKRLLYNVNIHVWKCVIEFIKDEKHYAIHVFDGAAQSDKCMLLRVSSLRVGELRVCLLVWARGMIVYRRSPLLEPPWGACPFMLTVQVSLFSNCWRHTRRRG